MNEPTKKLMGELLYTGDGPVTPYVVMARAIKATRENKALEEQDVSDALYCALQEVEMEGGHIPSSE